MPHRRTGMPGPTRIGGLPPRHGACLDSPIMKSQPATLLDSPALTKTAASIAAAGAFVAVLNGLPPSSPAAGTSPLAAPLPASTQPPATTWVPPSAPSAESKASLANEFGLPATGVTRVAPGIEAAIAAPRTVPPTPTGSQIAAVQILSNASPANKVAVSGSAAKAAAAAVATPVEAATEPGTTTMSFVPAAGATTALTPPSGPPPSTATAALISDTAATASAAQPSTGASIGRLKGQPTAVAAAPERATSTTAELPADGQPVAPLASETSALPSGAAIVSPVAVTAVPPVLASAKNTASNALAAAPGSEAVTAYPRGGKPEHNAATRLVVAADHPQTAQALSPQTLEIAAPVAHALALAPDVPVPGGTTTLAALPAPTSKLAPRDMTGPAITSAGPPIDQALLNSAVAWIAPGDSVPGSEIRQVTLDADPSKAVGGLAASSPSTSGLATRLFPRRSQSLPRHHAHCGTRGTIGSRTGPHRPCRRGPPDYPAAHPR